MVNEMKLELNRDWLQKELQEKYQGFKKGLFPRTILSILILLIISVWGISYSYSVYVNENMINILWFSQYALGIGIFILGLGLIIYCIGLYCAKLKKYRKHADNIVYGYGVYSANGDYKDSCIKKVLGDFLFADRIIFQSYFDHYVEELDYSDIRKVHIGRGTIVFSVIEEMMCSFSHRGIHLSYYKDVNIKELVDFLKSKGVDVVVDSDDDSQEEVDMWGDLGKTSEEETEEINETEEAGEASETSNEETPEEEVEEDDIATGVLEDKQ